MDIPFEGMKSKCLLCGDGISPGGRREKDPLVAAWDEESISILVSVLFQSTEGKEAAEAVLRNGEYCNQCCMRFRDLSLVYKIFSNARIRMKKLVKDIVEDVSTHVQKIKRRKQAIGTLEKSLRVVYNGLKQQKRCDGVEFAVLVPTSNVDEEMSSLSLCPSGMEESSSCYPQYHIIKDEVEDLSHDEDDMGSVSSGVLCISGVDCYEDSDVEKLRNESAYRNLGMNQLTEKLAAGLDRSSEVKLIGTSSFRGKRSLDVSNKIDSKNVPSSCMDDDDDHHATKPKHLKRREERHCSEEEVISSDTSDEKSPDEDLEYDANDTDDFIPSENEEEDDDKFDPETNDVRTPTTRRNLAKAKNTSASSGDFGIEIRKIHCKFEGCKMKFVKEIFMEAHFKKKHLGDPKPYQCSECISKFRDHTDFTRHFNNVHGDKKINLKSINQSKVPESDGTKKSTISEGKLRTFPVECREEECSKRFFSDLHMEGHYNKVHLGIKISPYRCGLCREAGKEEKGFHDYYDLKRHYRQVHQQVLPDDKTDNFKCQQCMKVFGMKTELNLHISIKHKEKPPGVVCPVCTKILPNAEAVDTHRQKFHEGSNPYKCEDCPKIFPTGVSLRNHVKHTHPPPGRVQCSICQNKSFPSTSHLKTHEYLNHPELRGATYKCEFCESTLSSYYQLREHKTTVHPDKVIVKIHSCPVPMCNKVFKRLPDLHNHKKKHTASSEAKCKCALCPKSFRTLHLLKSHEESHSGLRHICYICGKQLKKRSHLLRHIKTLHSLDEDVEPSNLKKQAEALKQLEKDSDSNIEAHSLPDAEPITCDESTVE